MVDVAALKTSVCHQGYRPDTGRMMLVASNGLLVGQSNAVRCSGKPLGHACRWGGSTRECLTQNHVHQRRSCRDTLKASSCLTIVKGSCSCAAWHILELWVVEDYDSAGLVRRANLQVVCENTEASICLHSGGTVLPGQRFRGRNIEYETSSSIVVSEL